jgi:hypothetical protein
MTAWLGQGQVRHTRLRPARHAFAYDTWFVMLSMRDLKSDPHMGLAINRRGMVSWHDADHGDGRGPEQGGALAWLTETLAQEGIDDADGEIWLHCYPRVLGYVFKPVSFWYVHRRDGTLRVVVAEVNNTFGERHCYLLDQPQEGRALTVERCQRQLSVPFAAHLGGPRATQSHRRAHRLARRPRPAAANQHQRPPETRHPQQPAACGLAPSAAHAGGHGPHPLARLAVVAQARAVLHQADATGRFRDTLMP